MDIERLGQIGSIIGAGLKRRKDARKSRTGESGKTAFKSILGKASENKTTSGEVSGLVSLPVLDGTETVEKLLDDVYEKSEALKRDSVFGPLNGYKTAVRRFLRYVIENSFEMEETSGIRNPKTMEQKKYIIIRVVDERLESLATHVLKNQSGQLDILRRIDEIHGMLVDLTG